MLEYLNDQDLNFCDNAALAQLSFKFVHVHALLGFIKILPADW